MDKKKPPAIQNMANKSKREIIKLCFNTPRQNRIIKTETLKFIDILYLCVLFKSAETHEGDSISGFKQDKHLLPLDSGRLFVHLLKKQIISLDTTDHCRSLVFRKSKVIDIDPLQEKWSVNTDLGICYIAIHFAFIDIPDKHAVIMAIWKNELRKIWLDIGLYECMEYLISELFDYGFTINISTKLKHNLLRLLNILSIAQCFRVIEDICCSCLAVYKCKVIVYQNTTDINSFILKELEIVRKNIFFDNDFEIIEIERPEHFSRSAINHLFFNDHFKFDGDAGVDYVPLNIIP